MQTSPVDLVTLPPAAAPVAASDVAIAAALADRARTLGSALDLLRDQSALLAGAAAMLIAALRGGQKVLVAGNGGSAAEAQHFATELVGRFLRERAAYPVLALTADSSVLTAIANDYGYDEVFARQVRALGQPGDLFVAFSTSGESENVVRAAHAACRQGLAVISVTGSAPSRLARTATLPIRVPASETPLVQELHAILVHLLCDVVETELAASERRVEAS